MESLLDLPTITGLPTDPVSTAIAAQAKPAALFYLAYVAGLVSLVSLPAIRTGAPVALPALIIGLMAYGTYEFTSWSVMKDWHWQMVVTDVTWGGVLTTFSAWAGVAITRLIHG